MISLENHNLPVKYMQFTLVLVLVLTILATILNFRRIKTYFIIVGFLMLTTMIIASATNGALIRQTQFVHQQLSQDSGCRYGMQSIGEESLKSELDCPVKYLKLEESPYVECGQDA